MTQLTKLLNKLKVDYDNVKEQFKFMITNEDDFTENSPRAESFSDDDPIEDDDAKQNPFGQSGSKSTKKSKTPVLDNFGRDLTALAEEGKLRSCCRSRKRNSACVSNIE